MIVTGDDLLLLLLTLPPEERKKPISVAMPSRSETMFNIKQLEEVFTTESAVYIRTSIDTSTPKALRRKR